MQADKCAYLKQIKDLALGIPVVGSDGFSGKEVTGSPGADGVMYTAGKINNPKEFTQKIKALPGRENLAVNIVAPIGYDTIMAFAKVMKSVGTNAEKIKEGLSALKMKGVSTPVIEFDKVGDLKAPQAEVMIIKNGKAEKYNQ